MEIPEAAINVEEIMQKIRENIRRRQAAGELPPNPDSAIGSPSKNYPAGESDEEIQRDISYINTYWDIHNNNYYISSHHPAIGKFLVKGRQIVHGEVRRYVDPITSRQTEFNASTVRIINHTSQRRDELNQRQQELETAFTSFDKDINAKVSSLTEEINNKFSSFDKEINNKFSSYNKDTVAKVSSLTEEINNKFSSFDKDINAKVWLAHVLEDRVQNGLAQKSVPSESTAKEKTNYFLFEERFRGSREDIKQRQLAFLQYFENCSRVLDIGCGRGEFLEILKDHNIGGIGVDSDSDMVAYCRSRQLEVEPSDAIAYLETLEDKSLDGIFIDQVVEHLEPDYLIRLLALCHQKMKFGYNIVVETVNPLSFVSFVNFYIDMTHKRPVHPETLQYLFSASGFRECEKKFLSPVSDEGRLKKIERTAGMNETDIKNIDVSNHNIEMLNNVLFGAQDYAVVGKK